MSREIVIEGVRFTVDEELTTLDRKVAQEPSKEPEDKRPMTDKELAQGLLHRLKP